MGKSENQYLVTLDRVLSARYNQQQPDAHVAAYYVWMDSFMFDSDWYATQGYRLPE